MKHRQMGIVAAVALLALLLLFPTTPAQAQIVVCARSKVTMPSTKSHRAWLENNVRYGPPVAADFFSRAEKVGDGYLQFQAHYFSEHPGVSGWFDVSGLTGLAEAHERQVQRWTCERYPLLLMIGMEPRAVDKSTLYVSPRKGIATTISLSRLPKSGAPLAMRLQRSNQLVCADLRTAEFFADERKCEDISQFFRQ